MFALDCGLFQPGPMEFGTCATKCWLLCWALDLFLSLKESKKKKGFSLDEFTGGGHRRNSLLSFSVLSLRAACCNPKCLSPLSSPLLPSRTTQRNSLEDLKNINQVVSYKHFF